MMLILSVITSILGIFGVLLYAADNKIAPSNELESPSNELPINDASNQDMFMPPEETTPIDYTQEIYSEENLRVILVPEDQTTLSSEVPITTVQRIFKQMGQAFKKDEILIQLDATIYEGILKKAQGILDKTITQLKTKRALYQDGIASTNEVKYAQADFDVAESDFITARHNYQSCIIRAPYDGKVVAVLVEEHELIQQGKPLIEVVNDTILRGKILVPSSMISKLELGKDVKVKIRETNSFVVGIITHIDAVIDPASSMIKVDLSIPNQDGKLQAGMIGMTQL